LYIGKYDGRIEDLDYDKDGIAKLCAFSREEIIEMLNAVPKRFKGDFQKIFAYL